VPGDIQDRRHSARELRLARGALVGVGVAYLVAQLAIGALHRPPGWDESVYLSQVTPGTRAVFFMASRARGITLLVAPVASLGGSIEAVRVYLTVASTMATVAAFWLWIPLIGMAAPLAAVAFSFSWLSLFGGNDVMPNLWVALLGLAILGLVARCLAGGGARGLVVASCLVGVSALFRPTDATVIAGAVGLYVLLFRRSSWRGLVPLAIGLVVGWLPWVIEMSGRFGGPVRAFRLAGSEHFATPSPGYQLLWNLGYTDARPPGSTVPVAGVLWWAVLVVAGVVAIRRARGTTEGAAAILCAFGAGAVAVEYVVIVSATAARFLLPLYAFAAIPFGIAVVSLLRGGGVARFAGVLGLALVVPWAIWQGAAAHRIEEQTTRAYSSLRSAGLTVRRLADGRPCLFVSPRGYPEIQLASGCVGRALLAPWLGPSRVELQALVDTGNEVFVVLPGRARPRSSIARLRATRASGPKPRWFVYRLPRQHR